MPRICKICSFTIERRRDVDRDITMGRKNQAIADQYGVTADNVRYHKKHHLHPQMAKASEIKQAVAAMDVFKELDILMSETREILKKAKAKGHNAIALHSIQQLRANVTLYAQIRAEMHKQSMDLQDISPEELGQFRAWKESLLVPDLHLEEFIASLPERYKDEYFRITFQKIQSNPTGPPIPAEKPQSEKVSDEDFFSDDKDTDTIEVEEDTTATPITRNNPLEIIEPVAEEPPPLRVSSPPIETGFTFNEYGRKIPAKIKRRGS